MSSFESKNIVHCGLCNYSAWKIYNEKGSNKSSLLKSLKIKKKNLHFKCSASCSPREAIGDIDSIEKDDTAK